MSSPAGLLLDTHVWARFINGSRLLKPSVAASIEAYRERGKAFVSVISIWEIGMLVKKQRMTVPGTARAWVDQALLLPGVRVLPLSPEILLRSVEFSDDLNADPSDRMLVATAQHEGLTFATADKDILRFAAKHKIAVLKV